MNLIKSVTLLTIIQLTGCVAGTIKESNSTLLSQTLIEADSYYAEAFSLINESKDDEAIEWAEKAAKLGHAQAQYLLGYMLHEGKAGFIQLSKAEKWYELAAQQGIKEAQFNLGVLAEDKPKIPSHYVNAHKKFAIEALEKSKEVNTILIGHHMGYVDLPIIQPSSCFEPNKICMNHYVTFKIKVKEVIAGEPLTEIIYATRLQHGEHIFTGSDLSLFIVTKIVNDENANLLKAGYYLREYAPPSTRYCLSSSIGNYMPELNEVADSSCMNAKLVYGDIKVDFIRNVTDKIEELLKQQNILVNFESGTSVGGKFISADLENSNCPYFTNQDDYAKDPRCNTKEEVFEAIQFTVQKGFGGMVNKALESELAKTKINFQSLKIKILQVEKNQSTMVEIQYKTDTF